MSEVDLIVVSHNQLEYTKKCFESIVRNVDVSYHLIWVDNNSTDGTRAYLTEQKAKHESSRVQITLILHSGNSGYADGLNLGIPHSRSPYTFFCNNDIEFSPGAVKETVRIAEADPKFGLVNPNSNEFGLSGYVPHELERQKSRWIERCHTSGFCVLVKRDVIRAIGGIDPLFGPAYFEDMDYAERAKKAGFLCVVAKGAYVHHFGTRTFLPKEKQALWDKHKERFRARWGGTKWLAFVDARHELMNEVERKKITNDLLQLARYEIAVMHVFVSNGMGQWFQNVHESFRVVELPDCFLIPAFVLKSLSSFKKKPIRRVYTHSEKTKRILRLLQPIHRAEVC